MDLRRVRTWEWLTGLAGLVLLVSLFLPWYSYGGQNATGWQSLTVVDVILAAIALGAMALPVVTAMQRTAAVPQAFASTIVWLFGLAAILALVRLASVPGGPTGTVSREAGVWIAVIASLAALACDMKSMRDKRFPAVMRPHLDIETVPAPLPDGTRRDVQ